jgi:Icc-related predicted phosphoesterase
MRILAISDTHNRHKQIKGVVSKKQLEQAKEDGNYLHSIDADVIVHAGDATGRGEEWAVEAFLDWYTDLPYLHKIFVPGNHDKGFEHSPALFRQMCEDRGVILLIDQGIEIDGVKFWGSPVQPWFCNWAFNRARNLTEATLRQIREIKPHWDLIPNDTNVLITHGPPYGILDELLHFDGTPKGQFVGCEELLWAVQRVKPDIHIFGHIHCGYGEKHVNGTSFYNASSCDEAYGLVNPPHLIELYDLKK